MTRTLLSITIAIALAPAATAAQLSQLTPAHGAVVGLELSRPFYARSVTSWYTSTIRARALFPVSPSARIIADWGVSVAGYDGNTDATFTNPEVGIGFGDVDRPVTASLTAILPIGFGVGDDDLSVGTGISADPFWPERFLDDLMSINAEIAVRAPLGERAQIFADIAPALLIPIGEATGDAEIFARYAGGLSYTAGPVRLSGALEGFALLSGEGGSFDDRTLHRILLAVAGAHGGPGLFVRIPADEQLDGIDAVVGLTFTF